MTDYTYKAASLAAISAALTLAGDISPDNMLGAMSVNDANGALLYRYGVGADGMFYIAVRALIDAADGITITTPEESAAVLGVWS